MNEPTASAPSQSAPAIVAPAATQASSVALLHRVKIIVTGHALYATFSWLFDNVLYPWVVYRLGLVVGGSVMTLLSLITCAVTLLFYERMGIDWVGAGSIARLSAHPNPSWWQRIILWADRRGAAFVFVALCILQDPFITTAYFRQGRFDGLQRRDWRIFFASGIIANFYWTLRSGVVAAVIVSAWHWFFHS